MGPMSTLSIGKDLRSAGQRERARRLVDRDAPDVVLDEVDLAGVRGRSHCESESDRQSTWLRRPLAWLPIRDLDRVARADVDGESGMRSIGVMCS